MKVDGTDGPIDAVWVCDAGHVDQVHRAPFGPRVKVELGIIEPCCSRGCEGVCELRAVKSRVTFIEDGDGDGVEREVLGPNVTVRQMPGRVLGADQRRRLVDGERPTIAVAKDRMSPLTAGVRYEVAPNLHIFVTRLRETVTSLVVEYRVYRPEQIVRGDAVDFSAPKAKQPSWFNAATGSYEPTSGEPEPINRSESSQMAKEIRATRIAALRESLEECKAALKGVENRTNKNANLCWGVRTTVERLEREITAEENADRPIRKAA